MKIMRIAPEGKKVIYLILLITFLILCFILFDLISLIALIPLLITLLFCINFFRDPKRIVPISENQIISPADGKIINIDSVDHELGKMHIVSIFLSVLMCM